MKEFEKKTAEFVDEFLAKYKNEEVSEFLNKRILAEVETDVVISYKPFHRFIDFAIAASIIFSFLSGILLSNLTFAQKNENIQIGEESLYSYFAEGE